MVETVRSAEAGPQKGLKLQAAVVGHELLSAGWGGLGNQTGVMRTPAAQNCVLGKQLERGARLRRSWLSPEHR